MNYDFICRSMEKKGLTKETIFINERMNYIKSLYSANPGETTLVVDIECPIDQKMLIRGVEDGNIKNFKDAYTIKLILRDKIKNEISQITKIMIRKKGSTNGIFIPIRCFYADIRRSSDDCLYYRPRKNIFLQGKDHLFIYVVGENIGKKLPDITIDKDQISFSIKTDIFRLKQNNQRL
jgi:hypothetical protein